MEEIRIGFIGCSRGIGLVHLNNLKKIKNVKIEGLYDPNEENIKFFIKEIGYDVKVFKSDEELIKNSKIDGVVICSPHSFHFSQTKMALENGIDVLVEKPAVINYQEAIELKKIIEKTGKKVVVGYQRHYHPLIKGVRDIIKSNRLGKIIALNGYISQRWYPGWGWRIIPEYSGKGFLTDTGSHFIALIFYLTSLTPDKISSFVDFKDLKVDVISGFTAKFKEGSIGCFLVSGQDYTFRGELSIWGEAGFIKIDLINLKELEIHFEGKEKIKYIESTVKNPAEDLVECIKGKKMPETPFDVIEKTAYLSDEIYKNLKL